MGKRRVTKGVWEAIGILGGVFAVGGLLFLSGCSSKTAELDDIASYPYESRISVDCIACTSQGDLASVMGLGRSGETDLAIQQLLFLADSLDGDCVAFHAGDAVLVHDIVRFDTTTDTSVDGTEVPAPGVVSYSSIMAKVSRASVLELGKALQGQPPSEYWIEQRNLRQEESVED